ncbi:MAG: amino acid adenylation domain-containing protein, partial [bacterium]|nr:amino acid adenylation domain-containing protein [bacterium]
DHSGGINDNNPGSHGEGSHGGLPRQPLRNFVRPFDLSRAPLMRVGLMETGEGTHILMADMHHIISDGVSSDLLEIDFIALYEDKTLPPLRLQYKDFSQWQNRESHIENTRNQESYWINEFKGEIPVLQLPTDYPRPAIQRFEGGSINFRLQGEDCHGLRALAMKTGSTLFMVLLSLTTVLLSKLSGQEDIVLGTPIAGRSHVDLEKIIGVFINTLTMRNFPRGHMTVKEFVEGVKERSLSAFENQEYPFEDLVERLPVERDTGRNPLFDVMFNLLNHMDYTGGPPGADESGIQTDIHRDVSSKFDLTVTAVELGDAIQINFTYSAALFRIETIRRFVAYFKRISSQFLQEPQKKLRDMEIIGEVEKHRLLNTFNDTGSDYPKDQNIRRLFENEAQRHSDRISVVIEDKHLTYGDLKDRSRRFGGLLRSKGIEKDRIVAMMMERSLEMIVGMLAVLESGGAYLPMDAAYPVKRNKFILQDSGAEVILTQEHLLSGRNEVFEGIQPGNVLLPEKNWENLPDIESLPTAASEDHHWHDLAYVIYTSGTSGNPKGVMVGHGNVVNLVYDLRERVYDATGPMATALVSPYVFDASVKQIFPSLLGGHRLMIVPEEARFDGERLLRFYKERNIRVSDGTPMHLGIMLNYPLEMSRNFPIRTFVIGGDALELELVNKLLALITGPNFEIINVYGPTECCDVSSSYTLTGRSIEGLPRIPIGKPLNNVNCYILGRYMELPGIGVAGELYIGGEGVARGYLNNPELTAEKFLYTEKDFSHGLTRINTDQHGSVYRTGDLVRWLADGNIEFLGRIDHQVKIRGYRIELGAIENRLLKYPGIKDVVVSTVGSESGDKYLCAYVVPAHLLTERGQLAIKEYLSDFLPGYMIPAYWVEMDGIPLTPNGKVDRKALPAPQLKAGAAHIAPDSPVAIRLARLWSEVLGIGQSIIGIDSNFFALGGHSLKATIIVSKIHKTLNVKVPLMEVFRTPTIRGLAQYIHAAARERYAAIEPAEKREYYVLSSAQKRMYILNRMDLESIVYNIPYFFPLEQAPPVEILEESFIQLINRHESLRTSFHMIHNQPVQKVHDQVEFEMEYFDGGMPQRDFIRPFDLSHAPLLRVGLEKTGEGKYILMVDMPHIISDGISMELLRKDFAALVEGKILSPLRIQYKDFSRWQISQTETGDIQNQESYWLKEFEHEIPVLNLPTDFLRPAIQSFEGAGIDFQLSEKDSQTLKTAALENGCTLFMVLLALTTILLSKLSGQEDVVIGTPIAGRRHADLEKIIGMFVNTLAFRNYPDGTKSVKEFIEEVKKRALDAFGNQEYPFEELVGTLDIKRDAGRNPLFDVMLMLNNINTGPGAGDTAAAYAAIDSQPQSPVENYENRVAKFDLTIAAVDTGENLAIGFQYCRRLFKKETVLRFVSYFKRIVSSIDEESNIKLSAIEVISPGEKQQLLSDFNETGKKLPSDRTIHEQFESQVERTPDRIAVIEPVIESGVDPPAGSRLAAVTYRELNEKSNQLARLLRSKGLQPDTTVGIMVERSIEMMTGIYAILKAGAAYLPVDPDYPPERVRYMLEDSQSQIMLTRGELAGDIPFDGETIDVGTPSLYRGDHGNLESAGTPDNLMYMIYTSGSTGNPKGVMVKLGGFINLLYWFTGEFSFTNVDCVLLISPVGFDLTQKNLFAPLVTGGSLCLSSPGLPDYLELSVTISREAVTVISCAPSIFYPLLQLNEDSGFMNLKSLRYIFLGGESILEGKLAQWLNSGACRCEVVNTYGPTECTDIASSYRVTKNDIRQSTGIPIGKPVYNVRLFVLDRYHQPVPIGVVGELYIGGAGLSKGYHKNPRLTAEKFLSIDHVSIGNVYRTGDLARWQPDGNVQFLGRLDHQVKVRGNRIELGEIESRLLNHPGIKEAVVIALARDTGDKYLCAYIVPLDGDFIPLDSDADKSTDIKQLRDYLSLELPDYMVPGYFVPLESIPLTPNGKVNRKALPPPQLQPGENHIAPSNVVEVQLAQLWSEVLGIEQSIIGIDNNFFELGGHSLKATIMAAKIHKALNIKVPLTEVFRTPTIRQLAQYIDTAARERYAAIEPVEKREYYPLSPVQKRLFVTQQMDSEGIVYNMPQFFPLEQTTSVEKLNGVFMKLIERHESLRTSFHIIDSQPVQKVHDHVEWEIEIFGRGEPMCSPLNGNNPGNNEPLRDFVRPFDLSHAPLLRVGFAATGEGNHMLMVDMHHIITDGISDQLLVQDCNVLFNGEDLPPLRLQYKDFSQWQNIEAEKGNLEKQERYWLDRFEGEIPLLDMPTDYPRPMPRSSRGSSASVEPDPEQINGLRKIVKGENVTMYILLQAVYNVFLAKISNRDDIVIGTTSAGRNHPDLEKIIGLFINTLALRNRPERDITFAAFVQDVKNNTLKALA